MARRRLVSRLELSRIAGNTKQAITEACNRGSLRPACVRDRVDLDHPAVAAYLKRRGAKVPSPAQPKPRAKKATKKRAQGRLKAKTSHKKASRESPAPSPKQPEGSPADEQDPRLPVGIRDVDADFFAGMTLERIAREYGTMDQFSAVLDAVRKVVAIREKDDNHAEFEGSVIPREFVSAHMMSTLDRLFRRFLGPVPKTTIREAATRLKAGKSVAAVEKMAIEINGKELKAIKSAIARAIRKA